MSAFDEVSEAFESFNHAPIDNTQTRMDDYGEGVVGAIMIAALLYATAGQGAWAEGGAAGGEAAAGGTADASATSAETGLAASGGEEAAPSLAENVAQTGVAETPADAALPPAAAPEASSEIVAQTGTPTADVSASSNVANTGLQNPPAAESSEGLISRIMGWAEKNPRFAVAGGLQVLGGIGQNLTQNQIMDKKTSSDKELLARKYAEEEKAAAARRAMVQSGSYFSGALPFSATSAKPLRRPDGSLVYTGGLIGNAMGTQP